MRSAAAKLAVSLVVCALAAACQSSGQPLTPCEELDESIDGIVDLSGSEALAQLEELAGVARAQGCPIQEARIYNGRGHFVRLAGHLPESLRLFDQGLKVLAATSGLGRDEQKTAGQVRASIDQNFGATFVRLGMLDVALDRLQRALVLREVYDGSPDQWANLGLQLARVHRLQGRPEEASEAVREGLRPGLAKATRSALWQEQARLDADAERWLKAESALDEALAALSEEDLRSRANIMTDQAELLLLQRHWSAALERVNEALRLAAAWLADDPNLEGHASFVRSVALLRLGRLNEAIQASDRGLSRLASVRDSWSVLSLQYSALRQRFFHHRLDLAAAADDARGAWDVIEGNHARLLTAGLGAPAADPAAEGALIAEIARLRSELLESLEKLDLVEPGAEELVRARREAVFRDRRASKLHLQQRIARAERRHVSLTTPAQASALLGAETLILIYAAGSEQLYLLALDTQHGLAMRAATVSKRVAETWVRVLLRKLDSHQDLEGLELDKTIGQLSHGLLASVADRLAEYRRVVIVADGLLERLPFEVLSDPVTGQPLIESHEIVYVPSLSVFSALRERVTSCSLPSKELIAAGDPVFGKQDGRWPDGLEDPRTDDESWQFPALEAAAREARAIASLYSRSTLLLGRQATRERVLFESPNHRVIHLASHARSDSEAPERSKIALSCLGPEGPVEGSCDLYLEEVTSLPLCGQLVVLSACSTAGGPSVPGEGILGLPRAFLLTGASTVVASHWRVGDDSTANLMESFHRRLRGGESPASALRQAKLELIAHGAEMRQWAPFVVLGDGWQ